MNNQRPLRPSETSTILALAFLGVQHPDQIPAVERLRSIGVPEELIRAATLADTSETYNLAEANIIQWGMYEWSVSMEEALEVLNKGLEELRYVLESQLPF